jgi:hypothetical protein
MHTSIQSRIIPDISNDYSLINHINYVSISYFVWAQKSVSDSGWNQKTQGKKLGIKVLNI